MRGSGCFNILCQETVEGRVRQPKTVCRTCCDVRQNLFLKAGNGKIIPPGWTVQRSLRSKQISKQKQNPNKNQTNKQKLWWNRPLKVTETTLITREVRISHATHRNRDMFFPIVIFSFYHWIDFLLAYKVMVSLWHLNHMCHYTLFCLVPLPHPLPWPYHPLAVPGQLPSALIADGLQYPSSPPHDLFLLCYGPV